MNERPELNIDPERETERVTAFVRSELADAGRTRVVLGLSGGIDSAVVGFLCARALGPGNVLGLILPCRSSAPETVADAEAVARAAGIAHRVIDITRAVEAFQQVVPGADRVRLGNTMARVRMVVLYDQSAAGDALVAGTGNRTEFEVGYTTLHGDSACAFAPILHLYKCQVRQLGAWLGVPEAVMAKAPTADLWPGQTDEGELGFAYDDLDWLLYNLLDRRLSEVELRAMGFGGAFIERVRSMMARSEFKRRMPRSLLGRE